MNDIKHLVTPEFLQIADIKQSVREYFELHRQQIKLPDGRMVLVNEMWRQNHIELEDGKTEEFVYFDQKYNVKFSFDPFTLAATVHGTESDFPEFYLGNVGG